MLVRVDPAKGPVIEHKNEKIKLNNKKVKRGCTLVRMRTYGQYCSVAKALDVLGDRWTLLIVRELLLRGASRYTDLRAGLPGIATNLLAERLRELERAGVVEREQAPPPIATTLFKLTPRGAQLEGVLDALGRWGVPLMSEPAEGDEFRSHWLSFPVQLFLGDREPQRPAEVIELRASGAGEPVHVQVGGGEARQLEQRVAHPDAVLSGTPQLVLGLLSGHLDLAQARGRGLRYAGEPRLLERARGDGAGAGEYPAG